MHQDFVNKVVIVTGAGKGIGFGLCQAFAKLGAFVALNDIDASLAQVAADKINRMVQAERVLPYGLDIADITAVREMVANVTARYGRLDIAIANAGITNFGPFLTYTPEAFDRVISVNLRGTYFTAQAAAQAMVNYKVANGRLILISSVTGVQAYPNLTAYGMTKAAICHLASALAVELGKHQITVNAICPGATLTERTLADDPAYEQNWTTVAPNGRVAFVDDIVTTTLFLASSATRHITGQTMIVDGGWTLTSPIPEDTPDMPKVSSELP